MEMSPTIGKLAEALAKAQGAMQAAKKDSDNPFFKTRYADLASVWDAVRKPLSDNGLSVVQTIAGNGAGVVITTILMHSSGEWIKDSIAIAPAKPDAQGYGAVISYMRRYSLSAFVGGYADDDDAETDRIAHEKKNEEIKPAPPKLTEPQKKLIFKLMDKAHPEHPINFINNVLASEQGFEPITTIDDLSTKWASRLIEKLTRLPKGEAPEPF